MPRAKASKIKRQKIFKDSITNLVPFENKNVLLSSAALINTLNAVHNCDGELIITEDLSKKQGHYRRLNVKCSSCDVDYFVDEEPLKKEVSFREHKLDNRRMAFAADCVGLDFNDLELLCSILNIPGPPDSYDNLHQEEIEKVLIMKINERFEKNRQLSRETHPKDDAGITILPVKTDGTYQKRGDTRRGYTSKVGIVLLADAVTDKYLDFVVLNKFCHQCTQMKAKLSEDDFIKWQETHESDCSANFTGASSEMERHAVRSLFNSSIEHQMRYKWLVADGDSKCYLDIWDAYGACEQCKKWEHLLTKRNSNEYALWTKTNDFKIWQNAHEENTDCKAVFKIDCIQHIGKCFRNKLEDLPKKGSKAPDGLSMYMGVNRLGPNARQKLQQYFNNAVRSNIRPGVLTQQQLDEAINIIRKSILASLFHCLMIEDSNIRHQYCPENSWCDFKSGRPMIEKSHYLHPCFKEVLMPIYDMYTSRQMLQRMVPGMNSNNIENTNSVIWNILGKSKYHGTRRTNIAVMLAITEVEDGKRGLLELLNALSIPIAEDAKSYLSRCDVVRKYLLNKRQSAGKDRYTKRLKEAVLQVEAREKSYSPGICDAGAGPSADMSFTAPTIQQPPSKKLNISFDKNCFVIIPFRPPSGWYAGRIVDVDTVSKKITLDWLYTTNKVEYNHRLSGDAGYEGFCTEYMNNVLCVIPPPDTICTSRRIKMVIPHEVVVEVDRKYNEWKKLL